GDVGHRPFAVAWYSRATSSGWGPRPVLRKAADRFAPGCHGRRGPSDRHSGERITVRDGSRLTVYLTFSCTALPLGSWSQSSTGIVRSRPAGRAPSATW